MEQYTDAYITDKLLHMWPPGWMKISEIQSHFMPKAKDKDGKKSSSEHKSSKPQHAISMAATGPSLTAENIKDITMVAAVAGTTVPGTHNAEKRKSHAVKESSKMPKYNHDKATLPKTDKKHHHSTADRGMAAPSTIMSTTPATTTPSVNSTSLLSMPLGDPYNSKTVRIFITFSNPFNSRTLYKRSRHLFSVLKKIWFVLFY